MALLDRVSRIQSVLHILSDKMITENMIEAGFRAYVETSKDDADKFITSIYEAMADARQKEAMEKYRESTAQEYGS